MQQGQHKFGTNDVIGRRRLHHPTRHMRKRPVRLADHKHLRSRKTLPFQDLHALTVSRVIPIKDPPLGVVILGSMPLVRPAWESRGWPARWATRPAVMGSPCSTDERRVCSPTLPPHAVKGGWCV